MSYHQQYSQFGSFGWFIAFKKSVSAFTIWVVVIGAFFLPNEISRFLVGPSTFAVQCVSTADLRFVVAVTTVSADGLSTAGRHELLRLYELTGKEPSSRTLLPNCDPACIALTVDGKRLFIGDKDGSLSVLHLDHPKLGNSAFGHGIQGPARSMVCSQDGNMLIVLEDYALHCWDVSNPMDYPTLRWCHVDPALTCFTVSADSQRVVCGIRRGDFSELTNIDIGTGRKQLIEPRVDIPLASVLLSADELCLVCVGATHETVLLTRDSSNAAWQQPSNSHLHSGDNRSTALAAQANLLIAFNMEGKQLVASDMHGSQPKLLFDPQAAQVVGCTTVDDHHFLSWDAAGSLHVWDITRPSPICHIEL